jgi:hypothetical protein
MQNTFTAIGEKGMLHVFSAKIISTKLGMVAPTCNPSTQEAEAGGLPVPSQPGLRSKTLSQNTNKQQIISTVKRIKGTFPRR